MSAVYPSVTETDIFTAVRTFLLTIVDCEVIKTPVNRVSLPKGDFIALTPLGMKPLALNSHSYSVSSETISRPMQYTMQVDCYGTSSQDRATTITTLFRDDYAYQALIALNANIFPLYADDAQQMPIVDGEEQYLKRWTFSLQLQVNADIVLTAETFDVATPILKNVDITYPP